VPGMLCWSQLLECQQVVSLGYHVASEEKARKETYLAYILFTEQM
jgi:hypothetical protein